MAYLRANSRRGEASAELHETAGIAGRHHLRRCLPQMLELGLEHGARHLGLEHSEQAGTAAAFRGSLNRHKREQRNRGEQLEWLRADPLRVEQMTRRIVGHVA